MIVKCGIKGCPTLWLRLPFVYLRLNPFGHGCSTGRRGRVFWQSARTWRVSREELT